MWTSKLGYRVKKVHDTPEMFTTWNPDSLGGEAVLIRTDRENTERYICETISEEA